MDLRIVNPDPKYSTVTLIPPTTMGYVHLAAEVRPPPRPGPVIRTPRQKAELIGGLKVLARQLEQLAAVEKVTVYKATGGCPEFRWAWVAAPMIVRPLPPPSDPCTTR
jgi:hypothetical protein